MTPTDPLSPDTGPKKQRRPADPHCDRAVGLRRVGTFPEVAIRGAAVVGVGAVVTNNVALGIVMVGTPAQPSEHDANPDRSSSRDGALARATGGGVGHIHVGRIPSSAEPRIELRSHDEVSRLTV